MKGSGFRAFFIAAALSEKSAKEIPRKPDSRGIFDIAVLSVMSGQKIPVR
jgi:hypothetical protein